MRRRRRLGRSNAHAVLVSRMGDGYYVGTRDPSAKGGLWLPTHAEAMRKARNEAKGRPVVDMTRYQ